MAMAETADLAIRINLEGNAAAGVAKLNKQLGGLQRGVGNIGTGFGKLSSGLGRAGLLAGGAAAAGITAVAKATIDFQDAFQGVVKTVDEADLGKAGLTFKDLEKQLRTLATQMPTTAVELSNIAAAAGAMGIAGKDIVAFTKQVAILGETTNVSIDDAATALGQMANIIGLTGDEFDNFAASLVDLGNKGNSTEAQILEIARRAGGAAKTVGIAKDETLGWAAAAANLGLNEELAGTALQNLFIKLLPKFNDGAKVLQKATGKTAAQLKKSFEKDAGGAIEDLLRKLGKMPKDQRVKAIQQIFGKGSGIFRLVNGLSESIDKNLDPSLKTAAKSWKEATAAQKEFDLRNKTVRSAIERLHNNITEAALVIGEGLVPALGRAADKLSKLLQDPQTISQLKDIGTDIGRAIDAIDWGQVIRQGKELVGVLKGALSWAKLLFDAFNALPGPLKEAAAGFLVINKLSGGLIAGGIADIAGGVAGTLARTAGANLPGALGRAFVQPVFVTNMPVGGLGGGLGGGVGGAAAKGGGIAGLAKTAFGIIGVVGAAALADEIHEAIKPPHTATQNLSWPWGSKNTPKILDNLEIGGVRLTGPNGILGGTSGPGAAHPGLDPVKVGAIETAQKATTTAVLAAKATGDAGDRNTKSAVMIGSQTVRSATSIAGVTVAGAVRSSSGAIIAAIYAARPVVNVSNITRNQTILQRIGPGGTSASGFDYGGGPGP